MMTTQQTTPTPLPSVPPRAASPAKPASSAASTTPTQRALRRLAQAKWRPMDGWSLGILIGVAWAMFFVAIWWLGR